MDNTCNHDSFIPQEIVDTLPAYQGAPVRHMCAACAYQAGIREGLRMARDAIGGTDDPQARLAALVNAVKRPR